MIGHTLHLGDCLDVLSTLPDDSVHSIVTDPPYGLSFMGRKWDYDVPSVAIWEQCYRVLKPGGHLLAFAGTRTQHRMAVNIEDAGFEIRDMIAWIYGSGFPKSLDVSKAIDKVAGAERKVVGKSKRHGGGIKGNGTSYEIDPSIPDITAPATPEAQQWSGWGTALKPALEPVTVARKPFPGTVAANVLQHGTGALNVDGCRVAHTEECRMMAPSQANIDNPSEKHRQAGRREEVLELKPGGRWPANLIHDGSDEVVALFPESNSSAPNASGRYGPNRDGRENSTYGKGLYSVTPNRPPIGDTGSAARFFMQCKGYKEAWPDLLPEPANTAGNSFSQQRQFVASALSDAATWALRVGICNSACLAPSTSATASELKQLCDSVITAIQSIGPRFWQGSQPGRLSLSLSHASVVVLKEPTGTTTITASHWKSDGSADPVTFNIIGTNTEAGDQGSAPRAFYTPKAPSSERQGVKHPTVKPLDLMAYLVRLVTPPGGTVLDPFMGSGTTIKAALSEGFNAIGIEREPEYFAMAEHRLNGAQIGLPLSSMKVDQ